MASACAAVMSICFVFFLTCPSTELENLMSGTTGFISANSDLGLAGGPAQLAVRPEDNSTPLNKEIGTVEFASAKDSGLAGGRINLLNTEPYTHKVLGGEAVLYEVFWRRGRPVQELYSVRRIKNQAIKQRHQSATLKWIKWVN